jgi:hypothetical protein
VTNWRDMTGADVLALLADNARADREVDQYLRALPYRDAGRSLRGRLEYLLYLQVLRNPLGRPDPCASSPAGGSSHEKL